ncbi:MAG TPA: PadR family transcriptional regulator [Candidatus Limnocylindrales bacterium]|jgi:PadR family transcriptional regulator PadR
MAGRPRETELRRRVLAILARRENYGYELAEELRRTDAGLELAEGSVYPALRRLERDGFVSGHWVEIGADVPRRRYYVLTPKGLAEVARLRPSQRPVPTSRRLGELRP